MSINDAIQRVALAYSMDFEDAKKRLDKALVELEKDEAVRELVKFYNEDADRLATASGTGVSADTK